jgi:ABC-type multidrug transport system ATPase subunit
MARSAPRQQTDLLATLLKQTPPASPAAPAVQIAQVSKRYPTGKQALSDVTLALQTGMFGLLGPNGAGKTTLMRILATLLPPSSGEVLVYGCSVRQQPRQVRRLLGYLPQQFNTYPQLTVAEFLDYFALLSGIRANRRAVVERLLEQVNLTEQRRQRTSRLSGGMKRRLGIAQALLNDPRLLIVDEPTAGLDPAERVRFRNLLTALSRERVIMLSTHIVEDIASTCNDLAVLQQGRVVFRGTPAALAHTATGKVWTAAVSQHDLPDLQARHPILRTVRAGSEWQVRLLAARNPGSQAQAATPTLEDGYMSLLHGTERV